jgi:hypothetical protein
MVKRLCILSCRTGLWLALAGVPLFAVPAGQAQAIPPLPSDQYSVVPQRKLPERFPEKPSLPPAFTVPVQPLGFSPLGSFYVGRHNTLISLDFLDENRLLFSFQVAGLVQRRTGDSPEHEERRVRAVVVSLPDGKIESEALWTLHDRARYLWMLNDGHFLLRDGDSVQQGDAALRMQASQHFPGRLLWIEMDPAQHMMDTNFLPPPAAPQKAVEGDSGAAPHAALTAQERNSDLKPDLVVRTLNRVSGQTVLENRQGLTVPHPTSSDGYFEVESAMLSGLLRNVQLSINSDSYLQTLRDGVNHWLLNRRYFSGDGKVLGHIDSVCLPGADFISDRELLVTACYRWGGWDLMAMSAGGNRLWELLTSSHEIWPLLVRSPDGLRVAQEVLVLNHPVRSGSHPLNPDDVKGQMVRVFDAADGKVALEAPASPTFDAGGNVAISPSGRRVAVLNDGGIQVFDLPAPTPIR